MQRVILQSDDDVVVIDGKEYTVGYLKVASNAYEFAKERGRRYKNKVKKQKQQLVETAQ